MSTHLAGLFSELVLASTSPARKALLGGLGVPFRAQAPGVDENVPEGTATPLAVAMLAERKARVVAKQHPAALVIGADQLATRSGRLLGKPADEAEAAQQLAMLAGQTHELYTAVCVIGPGFFATEVDRARLTMVPLSANEQQGYLKRGEWQGCAGGYRIEGLGQALFARIEGDRTAIQGLPMELVVRLLREAGVKFFA